MWQHLIMWVITAAISYLLAPKPPKPKPASFSDWDVPTAEQDRAIPVVFGTVTITGANVVWYGDMRTVAIKAKGGKK